MKENLLMIYMESVQQPKTRLTKTRAVLTIDRYIAVLFAVSLLLLLVKIGAEALAEFVFNLI